MSEALKALLERFHEIAAHPARRKEELLAKGEKIVLCAPVYTPEEIIHSMGLLPYGAWGGDLALNKSK